MLPLNVLGNSCRLCATIDPLLQYDDEFLSFSVEGSISIQ